MIWRNVNIMINLRELQEKDAPLMLEWMHDPEIQKCFQRDMIAMSLQDAENFCRLSKTGQKLEEGQCYHYAIVNEYDEYIGTISLKNINLKAKSAEYAISIRRQAQGKGIAKEATYLILKKGFNELGLHRIYLHVLANNERALKFYEKVGFKYEGEFREHMFLEGEYISLKWYAMLKNEFDEKYFDH